MLKIVFVILMLAVFGRMIGFAFRAAWGVTKILFRLILLPLFLVGLALSGFLYMALMLLLVVGIVMIVAKRIL